MSSIKAHRLKLATPPPFPWSTAFPETVLSNIDSVPALSIPPPSPSSYTSETLFPETVSETIVRLPSGPL